MCNLFFFIFRLFRQKMDDFEEAEGRDIHIYRPSDELRVQVEQFRS